MKMIKFRIIFLENGISMEKKAEVKSQRYKAISQSIFLTAIRQKSPSTVVFLFLR